MSAVIVIPARYDSTRFPGKSIALLKGKPVIQHVYENSKGAGLAEDVIVATDSEMIFETVSSFGGKVMMTSEGHESGTDRIAEIARSMSCDIIVNVQGDEPLIRAEMIDDVIGILSDGRAHIGTLVKKIRDPDDIMNPNVVKAVFGGDEFALYFSRAPIPYHRDMLLSQTIRDNGVTESRRKAIRFPDTPFHRFTDTWYYKHIGIYSYRREVLMRMTGMRPSRLEQIEKLEQLRALENGLRIKVKETSFETVGIDTPQDLERVEKWLNLSL